MSLTTRCGTRILRVTAIAHETCRKVASWHFVADLDFGDGATAVGRELSPADLCYDTDDDKPQVQALLAALADYLQRNGTWHDAKNMRDGRVVFWTPHKPADQEPLTVGE